MPLLLGTKQISFATVSILGQAPSVFLDKKTKTSNVDIKSHAMELTQLLGNEVHLSYSEETGKGKMTVNFYSLEELEGIVERINLH